MSAMLSMIEKGLSRVLVHCCVSLLPLALLLTGCGSQVSGGDQKVIESPNIIEGVTVRVNNLTGADTGDGLDQPYETLQYAINQLRPGDTLLIEDTGVPYTSNTVIAEERDVNDMLVKTLRGFVVSTSGTAENPIRIVGEGPGRPTIDQLQLSSDPANAVLGLLLDCVSHIRIQNIEIRNANEAGISSSVNGACETSGITIEENYIHDITGEKYVGGIRMMGVSDLLIRNNRIETITSSLLAESRVLNKTARGIEAVVIEGNQFDQVETGVTVNAQGLGNSAFSLNFPETVSGLQVANNVFTNVTQAVSLQQSISDAESADELLTGNLVDGDIFANVFSQLDSAVVADLGSGENQSNSICVFNNTLVETSAASVQSAGISGLELFNNIFVDPQAEVLLTINPDGALIQNTASFIDNNLFWNFAALDWRLASGGLADSSFSGLASWQAASAHPELGFDPDLAALVVDPQFADPLSADYSLLPSSPAVSAGRFGMSIGADFTFPANVATITNPCIERVR